MAVESFLPFDLDATFSSAVVLSLASTVDPSLLRNKVQWLQTVFVILDEMITRGSLIAKFHKSELQQLDSNLKSLPLTPDNPGTGSQVDPRETPLQHCRTTSYPWNDGNAPASGDGQSSFGQDFLGDWYSEDGLNGEQLMALADSLNFEHLDWMGPDTFQPLDPYMPYTTMNSFE